MLMVVKNAVGIQRPMSASGRLKAEESAYGKVGNSLRLLSFMVEFDSMISPKALLARSSGTGRISGRGAGG